LLSPLCFSLFFILQRSNCDNKIKKTLEGHDLFLFAAVTERCHAPSQEEGEGDEKKKNVKTTTQTKTAMNLF
jgi:hypothetical protein